MRYIKVKEAAQMWGVTTRRVQDLCKQGLIAGARRWERTWMIPADAEYPGRQREGYRQIMPRKSPLLSMTNLYHTPGGAEEALEALQGNPMAKAQLEAELAYYRGQIDEVYATASVFLRNHDGFYAVMGPGLLLSLCAMWKGDVNLWRKANTHICEAVCHDAHDHDLMEIALAASKLSVRSLQGFPQWFIQGRFGCLPADAHPGAKVYYIKCLMIFAQELALQNVSHDYVKGRGLIAMLTNAIEPFIVQAQVDRTVIPEIHLRLMCAVAYQNSGDIPSAVEHIDAALRLALPDQLLGLLAEYRRQMGQLLDERLGLMDPEALKRLKELHKQLQEGWTKLHNAVNEKTVSATLSVREREVARLAAFGYSDQEIADQLGLSKSTVKSLISMAKNKTGALKRAELAAFI